MFRIKICGITSIDDALLAADAGADAVGLNFFAGSPRCVTVEQAESIVDRLPDHIKSVGVFVNEVLDQVIRIHDQVGLDLIQLHGDEPPESLYALGEREVVRAFRCRDRNAEPIRSYLAACQIVHRAPAAILVDAYQPGQYGGTGALVDWQFAHEVQKYLGPTPLILAGGLTPENVVDAVLTARPQGVDCASGVERSPRTKDPDKVKAFVREALAAFQRLDATTASKQ